MTKWPLNPYEEDEYEYGLFNAISNKFIEAEKSGRMNVETLAKVLWEQQPYMRYSEEEMKAWAGGILTALYGDSEHEEKGSK